jgi:hypothetical protein
MREFPLAGVEDEKDGAPGQAVNQPVGRLFDKKTGYITLTLN